MKTTLLHKTLMLTRRKQEKIDKDDNTAAQDTDSDQVKAETGIEQECDTAGEPIDDKVEDLSSSPSKDLEGDCMDVTSDETTHFTEEAHEHTSEETTCMKDAVRAPEETEDDKDGNDLTATSTARASASTVTDTSAMTAVSVVEDLISKELVSQSKPNEHCSVRCC